MNASTDPATPTADELLSQWSRSIRRWCLVGLGDPVAADDAAQEAAMRLIQRFDQYDSSRPFEPWLRTLVRNVCIDQRRAAMRRSTEPEREAPRERDDDHRLDLRRAAGLAEAAFADLTERQREILLAVDLDGSTPTEVARTLGLAGGSVRNLLFKGRRKVRAAMLRADPNLASLLEGL